MTTTADWLFPQPRATSDDPAAYWPDTGFLVLPESVLSDELLLAGYESNPAHLPVALAEYSAIVGHEQTHWIQSHAFGYGRYLSRIDHARTEIAESFLGLYTAAQVEHLLNGRARGQKLLELTNEMTPRRRDRLGPLGTLLQKHWWSLGLMRHELENSAYELGKLEESRFRYGLASLYAAAGPYVSEVAMLPADTLKEAAMARAPALEYEEAATSCGFPWLTSVAIAECAAVLNQHWFYSYCAELYSQDARRSDAARIRAQHVRSWKGKEMTSYADAFRIYLYFNPSLDLNAGKPLATLCVLCCLALDGAFEPDPLCRPRNWSDISPPLRFVALARAVAKVGLLPAERVSALTARGYQDYTSRLCEVAGIAKAAPYQASFAELRLEPSALLHVAQLQHDAATAAATLLDTIPAYIVSPLEAAIYHDELKAPDMSAFDLAILPPLLSLGGQAVVGPIGEARFAKCALAGAFQRLMYQLFADNRPFNYAGLPTCATGKQLVEEAIKLASSRLERQISIVH